jgi:hypothetical protein
MPIRLGLWLRERVDMLASILKVEFAGFSVRLDAADEGMDKSISSC